MRPHLESIELENFSALSKEALLRLVQSRGPLSHAAVRFTRPRKSAIEVPLQDALARGLTLSLEYSFPFIPPRVMSHSPMEDKTRIAERIAWCRRVVVGVVGVWLVSMTQNDTDNVSRRSGSAKRSVSGSGVPRIIYGRGVSTAKGERKEIQSSGWEWHTCVGVQSDEAALESYSSHPASEAANPPPAHRLPAAEEDRAWDTVSAQHRLELGKTPASGLGDMGKGKSETHLLLPAIAPVYTKRRETHQKIKVDLPFSPARLGNYTAAVAARPPRLIELAGHPSPDEHAASLPHHHQKSKSQEQRAMHQKPRPFLPTLDRPATLEMRTIGQ
ncbi:hypothetical protein K438DRAFT_1960756 [Mycena galopus ATCC 62051]|nr:hypothetical protein K438DRAFT_1960756 [Mycena galopus ATCC 62051]